MVICTWGLSQGECNIDNRDLEVRDKADFHLGQMRAGLAYEAYELRAQPESHMKKLPPRGCSLAIAAASIPIIICEVIEITVGWMIDRDASAMTLMASCLIGGGAAS